MTRRPSSVARRLARACLALAAAAPIPLAAQALPPRVLVGYWQNWVGSPLTVPLAAVPNEYDVVDVSFATPTTPGGATMHFVPDAGIYASQAAFIADVRVLQSRGKKVLISIGGATDPVLLHNATDVQSFATSMQQIVTTYGFDGVDIDLEGSSLSLAPGDNDFRAPTTPTIVNLITAVGQLMSQLPPTALLTAAPETVYVQGGYGSYGGSNGAYLPVLHALRNRLTFVHVQHYNTGTMYGRDGGIYTAGTADFQVAMAESLLAGFRVDAFGSNLFFPGLRPDQVAIGLPATTGAAGNGYTSPAATQSALDYLILGKSFGGAYQLANANGYKSFRGLMTWSVNWDVSNNLQFARSHRDYLDHVFLRSDRSTIPASTGGGANLTLRAGRGNAGRLHALVAGVTGRSPGTLLPGGAVLPLNFDAITSLSLNPSASSVFQGFVGTLNGAGEGTARLQLPALPAAAGLVFDLAYVLPWDFASTAVSLALTP